MEKITNTELVEMLRKSLAAHFNKVEDVEIVDTKYGISIYPSKGERIIGCAHDIFLFAEAFNLTSYITIDDSRGYFCPMVRIY